MKHGRKSQMLALLIILLALSSLMITSGAAQSLEGMWTAEQFKTSEYSFQAVQLFPEGCTISLGKDGHCDIVMGDYKEQAKWEMKDDTLLFSGSYVFHTAALVGEELAVPFGGVMVYFSREAADEAQVQGTGPADSPVPTESAGPAGSPVPTEGAGAAGTTAEAGADTLRREEIVLPTGWTMDMAVSAEDIQQVTGQSGYAFFPEASSNAQSGKPACGFVKDNNPRLKLTFSAFLKDGADKLAFFLEFASEKKQLPNALWDSGYELAFSNGSKAVVVLKGSACFRIDWWPDGHPDDNTLGERLAVLLMNRVYGLDGG